MTPPPPGQPERRSGASNEALANSERLARLIKVVGILLAIYVALAVTVASVIGVVNSLSANKHAAEAERLAREARNQARDNGDIARNVETLVAQQAPCYEGDPPDSPACARQARSDAVVAKAIADIVAGIDTHDVTTKADHDRLLAARGAKTTSRTPISSAPRPTSPTSATKAPRAGASPPAPAAPPSTTAAPGPAPAPVTTTTRCETRGKSEKCVR